MKITEHAIDRAKERLGINKEALERVCEKVIEFGISKQDVSGRLARYLDKISAVHKSGNNTRLWGEHIFVIQDDTLITILNVDKEFKNAVSKALQKNKELEE